MNSSSADVVICGAGIAGIATAYHLAVRHGIRDIVLVDERAPLSLTSDKSTECYRNWWPGPDDAMASLMNRSIDLMEELAAESNNIFHLNRRGYLFATADPQRLATFEHAAAEATRLGAGPTRFHNGQPGEAAYQAAPATGFNQQPNGADLIRDPALIRRRFPYLSEQTVALLHARRCGWFSAQQLGMYLLERARDCGVRLIRARVSAVELVGGQVQAVRLDQPYAATTLTTRTFVNAAGPLLTDVGRMLGVDLPLFSELHIKVAFNDYLGVVPRDAPLVIWADPTPLVWADDERAAINDSQDMQWLLHTFPAGVHTRPEGGADSTTLLILWTYDLTPVTPVWPFSYDPHYPEIALRGLAVMIPGLQAYFDHIPAPVIDGGYYTKTRENRPLIGPLPVKGAYVIGALSGFGLMAACAAGELLAAYIAGGALPPYAPAFALNRYDDPAYRALLDNWGESWQL
ncbi:MAG: FAD-binding oxidoreductase [Chloroflexales bacterium]|nr:FAD-binding oxidoreductase [Chloroflexales bacterium]